MSETHSNSKICQDMRYGSGIICLDIVMQTICDTISHAKGIEELSKASFGPNQQCPACMVGKAHQHNSLCQASLSRETKQRD